MSAVPERRGDLSLRVPRQRVVAVSVCHRVVVKPSRLPAPNVVSASSRLGRSDGRSLLSPAASLAGRLITTMHEQRNRAFHLVIAWVSNVSRHAGSSVPPAQVRPRGPLRHSFDAVPTVANPSLVNERLCKLARWPSKVYDVPPAPPSEPTPVDFTSGATASQLRVHRPGLLAHS